MLGSICASPCGLIKSSIPPYVVKLFADKIHQLSLVVIKCFFGSTTTTYIFEHEQVDIIISKNQALQI